MFNFNQNGRNICLGYLNEKITKCSDELNNNSNLNQVETDEITKKLKILKILRSIIENK